MLAQRVASVASKSLSFSSAMRTGMKVFACSEHTMSHIPILKADMKKMFCVLNPSDKTKHNASVLGVISCFSFHR